MEVEAVVDDVELVRSLETRQRLWRHSGPPSESMAPSSDHPVATTEHRRRGRQGVTRREERDLVATGDEALGQQRGEEAPTARSGGAGTRHRDRRQDGDPAPVGGPSAPERGATLPSSRVLISRFSVSDFPTFLADDFCGDFSGMGFSLVVATRRGAREQVRGKRHGRDADRLRRRCRRAGRGCRHARGRRQE